MCFLCSLIPATVFVVVGYFVLFASTKAQGTTQRVGRALAVWIFVIALLFPIGGAYVALSGDCPLEKLMQQFEQVKVTRLPAGVQR